MAQFSIKPLTGQIAVSIQDDNGTEASIALDRHQSFGVILSIVQALSELPFDRETPIYGQQAVLKTTDPSFQVGVTHSGGVMLAIRPDPFPPLEFEFGAEAVAKLITDLKTAANVPAYRGSSAH